MPQMFEKYSTKKLKMSVLLITIHTLLRSSTNNNNNICNIDLLLLGLSHPVFRLQCRIHPVLVVIITNYLPLSSNIDLIHPNLRV